MTKDNLKIAVSDIDGTLINDNDDLPGNFVEMVTHLNDRDIIFVAASGRGLESIKNKLNHKADNLYMISDNGSVIAHNDKILHVNSFSRKDYLEIVEILSQLKNVTIAVSTPSINYVKIHEESINYDYFEEYFTQYTIVDDLSSVNDDFVSFSVYCADGSDLSFASKAIQENLHKHSFVVSGEKWIDAIPKGVNKGKSLSQLLHILNIKQHESIAFGDYNNDIQLLEFAGKSYAMEDATEDLKAVADEVIGSNNDNSVINKIYEILEIN